jgi:hypothetical protein
MTASEKGDVSESAIIYRILNKNYSTSLPFGNNLRYDLVMDTGNELLRVQCKTGRMENGCVKFDLSSTWFVDGKWKRFKYNKKEIDCFLVYCKENGIVYKIDLVDDDSKNQTRMSLRIDKPKTNKKVKNWAKDFEF